MLRQNRLIALAFTALLVGVAACGDAAPLADPTIVESDGIADGDVAPALDATASDAEQDATLPPDWESDADSEIAQDTAQDSAELPDAPGPVCPGDVGCPCQDDGDCPTDSGCGKTAQGKRCLIPCLSGVPCPDGQVCAAVSGDGSNSPAPRPLCAPKFPTLCDPCSASSDCSTPANPGAACLASGDPAGADGAFCGAACKVASQCPTGYSCSVVENIEHGVGSYCVPDKGQCSCSASAAEAGLQTACLLGAGPGTSGCIGKRTCGPQGLSACIGAMPAPEACDGTDNDCDGATDEQDGLFLCDDANLCTADKCADGHCEFQPTSDACDDGSKCTDADTCKGGYCVGKSLGCDDGNPCTGDSCNPASGCVFTPNKAPCDDGDACSVGDQCGAGVCVPGKSVCTCQSDGDCAGKNDDNACNGNLFCDKAVTPPVCHISPSSVVNCQPSAPDACLGFQCDPADGNCKPTAKNEGKACNDGSACTVNESCLAGSCASKTALICDDANSCTADACDKTQGCTHTALAGACLDGDACTTQDHCEGSTCKGLPVLCDDGYLCTDDACKGETGCVFTPKADATCGVVPLPYAQDFSCGSGGLAYWQRSGGELAPKSVRWEFDQTPALSGSPSGACTLNVNNGQDLVCGEGQNAISATADSPWIDATGLAPGTPMRMRMHVAGTWSATAEAAVLVRVGKGEFAKLATLKAPGGWQALVIPSTAWAGQLLQIRLSFSGPCGTPGAAIGWFVDDFLIYEDKCSVNAGGCLAGEICSQDGGGPVTCTACPAGHQLVGGLCVDIDECAQPGACAAQATCKNSVGGYECTCAAGWVGDGKTCTDVDECATGQSACSPLAQCTNTPGSYSCKCANQTVGDGYMCAKKGSAQSVPAVSCLEVLQLYWDSTDGNYWLDFDGSGPSPNQQYYCDMKNGGWTLLFFNDFENGDKTGWSHGNVGGCGGFSKILGGYDDLGKGETATRTVGITPPHSAARYWLDYLRIDSWDSETSWVRIDNNQVWSQKGAYWNGKDQCGDDWKDEKWSIGWSGGHGGGSISLTVGASLDEGAKNESFGLDNVSLWVK